MNERMELVAPCGIDCGICEMHLAGKNEQLFNYLVASGIPKEILPCKGCNASGGKCPIMPGTCATYECTREKGVSICSDCNDFPCMKLAPAADRSDKLPHNLKVFNLSTIKTKGLEAFTQESISIKQHYFKGKMVIGRGPQLTAED